MFGGGLVCGFRLETLKGGNVCLEKGKTMNSKLG